MLTCQTCTKKYVGQTVDNFRNRWNNYKCNDKKSSKSQLCFQEHIFNHFDRLGHSRLLENVSVTFIQKTFQSLKSESYWIHTRIGTLRIKCYVKQRGIQNPVQHLRWFPPESWGIPQRRKDDHCSSGIISKNTSRFHSTHELNQTCINEFNSKLSIFNESQFFQMFHHNFK